MTDDTDVLMRDFRGFAQTKKAYMQTLLREEYRTNDKLPGKSLLEKSIRLIDDVLQINDPMTFYKRVDELYDDWLDNDFGIGEDIRLSIDEFTYTLIDKEKESKVNGYER